MLEKKYQAKRREFLRQSLVGAAGLSFLPLHSGSRGTASQAPHDEKSGGVVFRTLGRTGIRVPVVSLGALSSIDLVQRALDAGVTHFDTAYRYGAGMSEMLLGQAFKGRPRESYIAATKILGIRDNVTGLPPRDLGAAEFREDFRKKLEVSLKRLGVDYLDILFLHGVERPDLLSLPLIKDVLQEVKEEGKTRFLGATFHHKELELIPAVVKEGIYDVILTSHNFRQPHREEVRTAIASAAQAGLGIIAMKTVAGAFWDRDRKFPINVRAALKWVLQSENVHTIIPGVENFDQLAQNVGVMEDLHLTAQEEEDLRFGEKMKLAGLYCAQCGACREQCPFGLEIPAVMRSFMYAYGYRQPAKAKATLLERERDEIVCRSCTRCAVSCIMGFDVSGRMRDVIRLLDVPDEFLA